VVKFSKVADDSQRRKADLLLNYVGSNVFWLNPDFFTVAKNEVLSSAEQIARPTHSDLEFAAFFVTNGLKQSKEPQTLGPQNLFGVIHTAPGIPKKYDDLADLIAAQIERLRRELESNKAMRAAIKVPPKAQPLLRGTRIIARELIARFLRDKTLKLSRNNAIDLSHAVVSVSYCDYVLLDGQWEAMVNEARSRIAKAGVSMPIAKVFSKRGNGVENFLYELETGASKKGS
jgi:hypothetical protein